MYVCIYNSKQAATFEILQHTATRCNTHGQSNDRHRPQEQTSINTLQHAATHLISVSFHSVCALPNLGGLKEFFPFKFVLRVD